MSYYRGGYRIDQNDSGYGSKNTPSDVGNQLADTNAPDSQSSSPETPSGNTVKKEDPLTPPESPGSPGSPESPGSPGNIGKKADTDPYSNEWCSLNNIFNFIVILAILYLLYIIVKDFVHEGHPLAGTSKYYLGNAFKIADTK